MHVHVLQHVPFEDIGSIGDWARTRKASLTYTRFYESPALPDPASIDLLVVMGGPMSANDEATLPWLVAEKRFVREAIERGVAVLGICLGSQLIASALGATVRRNPVKEIGWFPIEAVPVDAGAFRFPASCEVFHWHGETFDLPPGAKHLARSAACEHQAFQIGRRVVGLQFHLEMTPEGALRMTRNCADEMVPGPCVQSADEVLAADPARYAAVNRLMSEVLDYLTTPAATRAMS